MEQQNLKIRAVIFDVYGTLLNVAPSPFDAEHKWENLCQTMLKTPPKMTLAEFGAACNRVIQHHHASAHNRGIQWPEVFWPDVVREALPELGLLSAQDRDLFLFEQSQIWHTVTLFPVAAETLSFLRRSNIWMGIASNAQAYTLRELNNALTSAELSDDLFCPDLVFWSFLHGFSKPDPHVFQILTNRLKARGIAPEQTLMVGDRMDNDIIPAQKFGWKTWQITDTPIGGSSGSWQALLSRGLYR